MVWDWQPGLAPALMTWAGTATADHKYANCIPGPAKALIRRLAAPFAALLPAAAITCPAWIFSGSGRFRVISRRPPVRRVADNPVGGPCHRHASDLRAALSGAGLGRCKGRGDRSPPYQPVSEPPALTAAHPPLRGSSLPRARTAPQGMDKRPPPHPRFSIAATKQRLPQLQL